jgi:uncharacterized protein (UPF0335 family)
VGKRLDTERQDLLHEIKNLKHDLQLNDYSQSFIALAIKSKDNRQKKEEKPVSTVYIPYVKGFSEKFKCIGNRYNI